MRSLFLALMISCILWNLIVGISLLFVVVRLRRLRLASGSQPMQFWLENIGRIAKEANEPIIARLDKIEQALVKFTEKS